MKVMFTSSLFVFILLFIYSEAQSSIDDQKENPQLLDCGAYPKAVNKSNGTVVIFTSNKIFNYLDGCSSIINNKSEHKEEIGALYNGDTYAYTSINGTSFTMNYYISSIPKISSSSNYYSQTISVFSLGKYLYSAWIGKNSNSRNILYFMFYYNDNFSKSDFDRNADIGAFIDCITILPTQFICIYTDKYPGTNNHCIIQKFKTYSNKVEYVDTEIHLTQYNCTDIYGVKFFKIENKDSVYLNCFLKGVILDFTSIHCMFINIVKLNTENSFYIEPSDAVKLVDNCQGYQYNYDIGYFGDNLIGACLNENKIIFRLFTDKLIPLGEQKQLVDPDYSFSLISVLKINSTQTLITAQPRSENKGYYRVLTIPKCSNFKMSIKKNTQNIMQNFKKYLENQGYKDKSVIFLSLPSDGIIYISNDNKTTLEEIEINKKYAIPDKNTSATSEDPNWNNEFYYQANATISNYTFIFKGVNEELMESGECIGTIKVESCYPSCFNCTAGIFDDDKHQCEICDEANGFYEYDCCGKDNNCNKSSNYKNCYSKETKKSNYYFNNTNKNFCPCDISCAKCVDDNSTKCIKCNELENVTYYWTSIEKITCHNGNLENHYFDEFLEFYRECYESCLFCDGEGNDDYHNCNTCDSNYFLMDDTKNCYKEAPLGYYISGDYIKKCNEGCANCTASDQCDSCISGYYKTSTSKCINPKLDPTYYLDSAGNIKNCSDYCNVCSTCENYGNGIYCLTFLTNNPNYTNNNCPSVTCTAPLKLNDGKCVTECPPYTIEDSGICKTCQEKYPTGNKYYYKGKCINDPTGKYIANKEYLILDDCYPSCKTCIMKGNLDKMNCLSCLSGYYALAFDSSQCYNDNTKPDNYYKNGNFYYPCYGTCGKCESGGNDLEHNCTDCQPGFIKQNPKDKITNCVNICEHYWYDDKFSEGLHICTEEKECPPEYPYLIEIERKCVAFCSGDYKYTAGTKCYESCPQNSIEYPNDPNNKIFKCYVVDEIAEFIEKGIPILMNGNTIDKTVFIGEVANFHLCSSSPEEEENCRQIESQMGLPYINLTECLKSVSQIYNIGEDDTYYYGVVEILRNDTTAGQFYYIMYLNDTDKTRIDTDFCYNSKITVKKSLLYSRDANISTAIEIYKKYKIDTVNYTSNFFKEICTLFPNEENYDLLLNDRYKDYYKIPNYHFCEKNCKLVNISLNDSSVICECLNKNNTYSADAFINFTTSPQIYKDTPFQFFKCYKLVFKSNIFSKNIGNYFLFIFTISHIILWIYFYQEGRKELFSFIHNEMLKEGNAELEGKKKDDYNNNNNNNYKEVKENNENKNSKFNSVKSHTEESKYEEDENVVNQMQLRLGNNFPSPPPKNAKNIINKVNREKNEENVMGKEYANTFLMRENYEDISPSNPYNIINYKKALHPKNTKNNNNNNNNSNYEPNSDISNDKDPKKETGIIMPIGLDGIDHNSDNNNKKNEVHQLKTKQQKDFDKEIGSQYDDISFCHLYLIALQKKYNYIWLFYNRDIYDIFSFKLAYVIFVIAFDFFISTFMVFNFNIRMLYHEKKHVIIYLVFAFGIASAAISRIITKFIWWFLEYREEFEKYKKERAQAEDKNVYFIKMNKLMSVLKLKFFVFYLLTFLFCLFDWYFVTAFCATYHHSQKSWGFTLLVNVVFSILVPFIYYAFITALQSMSLKYYNKCLYSFAMFMLVI